jgi:protein arginine kinase
MAYRKDLKKVVELTVEAIKRSTALTNSIVFPLDQLATLDRQLLREKHLISFQQSQGEESRMAVISKEDLSSLMVNEEDHLRLQNVRYGFQLRTSWQRIKTIDMELQSLLDFAYLEKWGFLTVCPTNTGTGMRASMMMFLPGLVLSNKIKKVLKGLTSSGFTIRGTYGEGSDAKGYLFQISNQITLGRTELEIIKMLEKTCYVLIAKEETARQCLLEKPTAEFEDKIAKAFRNLKDGKKQSLNESVQALSLVRLGICLKFVKGLSLSTIDELLILVQPAHTITYKFSRKKQSSEMARAELIQQRFMACSI